MKTILFLLLAISLYAQSEPFIAHYPEIQKDCCICPEENDYQVEYHYYIPIDDMPITYSVEYEYPAYHVEYIYYDQQLVNELYRDIENFQTNYSGRDRQWLMNTNLK